MVAFFVNKRVRADVHVCEKKTFERGDNRTARLAAQVRLIEGLGIIAIARPSVGMASRTLRW